MSERMVKQFIEMVRIPSESGNEAGMIAYLEQAFSALGAETTVDDYGNLVAKLPALGCEGKDPVLLSCHADTVQPGQGIEPVLEDGVIRSKGNTILGADDKAGIAEMLEALRIAEVRPPVEVAISRQEEVGLLGLPSLQPIYQTKRLKSGTPEKYPLSDNRSAPYRQPRGLLLCHLV